MGVLVVFSPSSPQCADFARSHRIAESEDFILKARIGLKLEKRLAAHGILELKQDLALVQPGGWNRIGHSFTWTPGRKAENLILPFSPPSAGIGIALADYNELWVDYREILPGQPGALSVDLALESTDHAEGKTSQLTATAALKAVHAVEEINAGEADWVKKNNAYGLGRLLRRPPDEKWRYVIWKGFTVIQRRLHRNLAGIEAMDIMFTSEFPVESLNLRIGTRDNYGPGKMIELQKGSEIGPDIYGNQSWHVDILKILGEYFSRGDKAYLQEVIAFVKGDAADAGRRHPLKKVIFFASNDAPDRSRDQRNIATALTSRTESVTASVKRMIIDLHDLNSNPDRDVLFKGGRLIIYSKKPIKPCAVTIEKIRLVGIYDADLPIFLHAGEKMILGWGGPFINPPDPADQVEWPEIASYLPFEISSLPLPARKDTRNSLAIEGGGALRSDKPFTKVASGRDGLVLEGSGRWLEASWPVSADVDKDSIFFMHVSSGTEQFQKVVLTAGFEQGSDMHLVVEPNMPERLLRKGKIARLSFRINLVSVPFRIKLKEAALFRPVLLTQKKAFVQKLPTRTAEKLVVSALSTPLGVTADQDGDVLRGASVSNEGSGARTLRWTTFSANHMEWARGLRFSYHVPHRTVENPCWLNLTLKWDKCIESKDVCLNQASGEIFLPVAGSVGYSDYGKFRSADWKATLSVSSTTADNSFEFRAALEGIAMRSPAQELASWPVFISGGRPLGFAPSGGKAGEILKGPMWLGAGVEPVLRMISSSARIQPVESPWFRVDSNAIELGPSVPQSVAKKLMALIENQEIPSEASLPSRISKLDFCLVLALLLLGGMVLSKPRFNVEDSGIFRTLTVRFKAAGTIFWLVVTVMFYGVGIMDQSSSGQNHYFTFGAIAAVFLLRYALEAFGPALKAFSPTAAEHIFNGTGKQYLACALLALIVTAGMVLCRMRSIAEQSANVAYYCLIIGIVKESIGIYRDKDSECL